MGWGCSERTRTLSQPSSSVIRRHDKVAEQRRRGERKKKKKTYKAMAQSKDGLGFSDISFLKN